MRDRAPHPHEADHVLHRQLADPQTLAEAERQLAELDDAPPLPPHQIDGWVRLATQPPGTTTPHRAIARRQLLAAAAVLVVLLTGSIAWANRQTRSATAKDADHATQFATAVDAAAGAALDEPQRIGAMRVLLDHCNYAIETLRGIAQNDAGLAGAATAALADVRAALEAGGDYRSIDGDEDLLDAAAKATDRSLTEAERAHHLARLRRLTRYAAIGLHHVRMQTEDGRQMQEAALAMMRERCVPPGGDGR